MTTLVDGDITVTISTNNTNNININLSDSVGQLNIGSVSGGGGGSFTSTALAAGTYYIRVSSNLTTEYSGYNVSYHLTPTAYNNDVEPNDISATASIINVNDSTTGHIMHRLQVEPMI
ncbi:MAG: pre-peptidase C-terminal domain-containing protein [Bacteroidetes bacterium]|nr:pre-peptidase C-terminal domain-containing protein [Bacteroidota bacterium]